MTNSQKYIKDIKDLIKKNLSTKEIIEAMLKHPYKPQINSYKEGDVGYNEYMESFKIKLIKTIINNNNVVC